MSAGKLFQAIVTLGIGAAAGVGCGGRSERAQPAGEEAPPAVIPLDGGSDAIAPPDSFWPGECEYRYQYVCDSYSPLRGCRCDAEKPRNTEDCGGPTRTRCTRTLCAPNESCFNEVPDAHIDCECVSDAPFSAADCDGPGQFVCEEQNPEHRDCRCETDRPRTHTDCPKPEDYFCDSIKDGLYTACRCGTGALPEECAMRACDFRCQSEEPRFGCECGCVTIV